MYERSPRERWSKQEKRPRPRIFIAVVVVERKSSHLTFFFSTAAAAAAPRCRQKKTVSCASLEVILPRLVALRGTIKPCLPLSSWCPGGSTGGSRARARAGRRGVDISLSFFFSWLVEEQKRERQRAASFSYLPLGARRAPWSTR